MTIEELKPYLDSLAGVANLFTIAASGLAIYLYFSNRTKLSAALQLLLNYSFQTTLSELKEKLERLNEYNANEPTELPEIRNILHEIAGQIRGNERLGVMTPTLATKIENLAQGKRLSEPSKRAIVSEVREQLKNIQVNNIE
ncbi:MAG: hypothetical protein NTW45_04830 [Rhodocyclales bacterium]|nr:hypothetical protein [Rhodocyclales bacterium]